MLAAKIILVIVSLLLQGRIFRDEAPAAESDLDTLALSELHPELTLAHRAMVANGLCPATIPEADKIAAPTLDQSPAHLNRVPTDLTALCY